MYDGPMAEPGHVVTIRTMFLDRLGEPEAATVLDHLRRGTSPLRLVQLRVLGGAISRVDPDATAFAHRRSRIMVNVHDADTDHAAARRWVDGAARDLAQDDPGAYVGFLGPDDGPERIHAAYPPKTLARLRRVKAAYDPENLFRHNDNIPPAD
jgi:hypothetical protein